MKMGNKHWRWRMMGDGGDDGDGERRGVGGPS